MSVRETDLDRITVKIHNMKRSASRDSLRMKRRGSVSRYDSSDERLSPERVRRRMIRSPSPRSSSRYMSPPHRGEYERPIPERPSYKVLCVSALHPKASDEYIKDTLYREYKKFGDFSIRIHRETDERVAYVCFRTPEDAREAKHHKPRVILYDKVALVEPVYEASSRNEYRPRQRSVTPPPEFDRYHYGRPPATVPIPVDRRRPPMYESYGPPPSIPGPMHPREFRPMMHHEYMPPRPIMRHMAPHMHPPPHPYMPRHIMPTRMQIPYEKPDTKKDKFPNYLHHVQPEDDPLATRTLFAGNLEVNISDEELRRIFGKYGIVEDIDIKRPPPGTGNAFAFVRYQNLDMAHRAKVELSGQYIGKFQCKIGYGKATPTSRIWIGGLGAWTSVTQLEREFDRFGAIKKIEYQKGDTSAYILYESIEAATAAGKEMRGFPLGGPDKRLRTDFADVAGQTPAPFKKNTDGFEEGGEYRRPEYDYHEAGYEEVPPYHHYPPYHHPPMRGAYRGRGGFRGRAFNRGFYHNETHRPQPHLSSGGPPEEDWNSRPSHAEYDRVRSNSREPGVNKSRSRSPRRRSLDSDSDSSSRRNGVLSSVKTLSDIVKKCTTQWQGALILKSSLFPAKLFLTDGDLDIVESLMKDEHGKHNLRITQRLRLDLPKLDDVQKRMTSSSSHAIFLGMAAPTSSVVSDDSSVQTRPLRNLVSYLKQKEAAGVISLLNKDTEATGVLYAFPPCDFSTELLKRTCHSVSEDGLKEDHLVIVVVRGGTA